MSSDTNESQPMVQGSEKEEDSDDEPIVTRKKKTKRSILEDSDEDEDANEKINKEDNIETNEDVLKKSSRPVLGVHNASPLKPHKGFIDEKSGDYDSDKENINPRPNTTEEPPPRAVLSENEESEANVSTRETLAELDVTDPKPAHTPKSKFADLFDAEESDSESATEGPVLSTSSNKKSPLPTPRSTSKSDGSRIIKHDKLLSELFDAEESEEEKERESDEGDNEQETADSGNASEQSDEEDAELSAALRKRLAKGAAKNPTKTSHKSTKSKTPGINREELQELHSETQRMVREKDVHMPYHQPKKLGLDVFLARTKQKQEALNSIKGSRGWKKTDITLVGINRPTSKTKDIVDLTNKNGKHGLDILVKHRDKQKAGDKNTKKVENGEEIPDLVQRLKSKQDESRACPARKMLVLPKGDNLVESMETVPDSVEQPEHSAQRDVIQKDESTETCTEQMEIEPSSTTELVETDSNSQEMKVALTEDIVSISLVKTSDENTIKCVPTGTENCVPEPDSGYLTTPAPSSSEDSNGSGKDISLTKDIEHAKEHIIDSETVEEGVKMSVDVNQSELTVVKPREICAKDHINSENTEIESDENKPSQTEKNESSELQLQTGENEAESGGLLKELPVQSDQPMQEEGTETPSSNAQMSKAKAKLKLITPKLEALGLNKLAPKLSGGPDAFIDLDEASEAPEEDPGVMNLIQRFMKHSAKRPKAKGKDVEVNTVTKQVGEGDKEELKLEKIIYHIDSDEDTNSEAIPGAKLVKLKTALQEQMAKNREEARKLRSQEEQYDNEEGFEEEEEAEMTDEESDSDEEIDEEEEEEELDEEEYGNDEKEIEANPFVDKEAAEDRDEEEDDLHLEYDTNDAEEDNEKREEVRKSFLDKAMSKTKALPNFDNGETNKESEEKSPTSAAVSERPFQHISQNSASHQGALHEKDDVENKDEGNNVKDINADSSFELMGSLLPAAQRSSKKAPASPSSLSNASSTAKKLMPFFPIENTQDLFAYNTSPTQVKPAATAETQNESFNMHLEDSQSVMLDAEGFLQSTKKAPRRQLLMPETSTAPPDSQHIREALGLFSGKFPTQKGDKDVPAELMGTQGGDSMDGIIGLCSGKFATQPDAASETSNMAFDAPEGMSQLLGLCSGRFTSGETQGNFTQLKKTQQPETTQQSESQISHKKKKRAVIEEKEESDDEGQEADVEDEDEEDEEEKEEEEDFIVESADESENEDEAHEASRDEFSDEGEESDKENEEAKFKSFFEKQGKKKKMRQDFVEDEAELSGSEADSDENDDLDDEADVMEEEAGDLDVNMTEEALRNQVNRVHMKTVIDEDDRQLRMMKEIYLQDGDLYSEGGGRLRRFRWSNMDEGMEAGGMDASDTEEQTGDDPSEEQWRRARFEREKFLKEQQEKGEENEKPEEGASINLGNVTFKQKKLQRSESVPEKITSIAESTNKPKQAAKQKHGDVPVPQNMFKVPMKRAGSLLTRGKDVLDKIATWTKPVGNVSGPRHTRGMLFNTLSKEEKEEQEEFKKPQMKRSISTPTQPAAKKQKLERVNTLPTNSIFNILK